MRQGQQNRRGRGRGGRKGQNPLSRSFESSGPDIKIRGTAQHIAEKYMALARDAIGSGDLVLGENYLQHAEHYNRIIMAAQTLPQNGYDQANGQRIARPEGDLLQGDGDGYDGDDDGEGDQPNINGGGGYDQPRSFEQGGQREQHNPQQHRNRDNRNFEHRNYDNRRNDQQRSFEPRGQGSYAGQSGQGGHGSSDRSSDRDPNDQRNGGESRFQEQPRQMNGAPSMGPNGDQPRTFDPPRPFAEPQREARPAPEGRPAEAGNPRGRRRRGRHENGAGRAYQPQVGPMDEPGEAASAAPDVRPAESADSGERGSGGHGGGNDSDGSI